MKEVWKYVKGFGDTYLISNFGRVRSFTMLSKGRLLKPQVNCKGYNTIQFKRKTYNIGHLVWDAFGNGLRNGFKLQVDHIDENKLNDRIDNLQLLHCRDNVSKSNIQHNRKTSKYPGVSWGKHHNKWMAYIKINGKSKNLGGFNDEYEASLKYQTEKRKYISQ